jgi:hypothetical protein
MARRCSSVPRTPRRDFAPCRTPPPARAPVPAAPPSLPRRVPDSTGVASRTHPRVARPRRRRGGDQPESRLGPEGPRGALPVLGARPRYGAVHPGLAARPAATMTAWARTIARARSCSRSACRSTTRSESPLGRAGGFSPTDATSASSATSRIPRAPWSCRCPATWARSTPRRPGGHRPSPIIATPGRLASWQGTHRRRVRRRRLRGHQRVLGGAHDGDHAQAPDALLHRGQRPRHLREGRHADAGRNIARNLASFTQPVPQRRRRRTDPTRRSC